MLRHFILIQILVILLVDIIFNEKVFNFVEVLHYKYSAALIIYPVFILFISIFVFFLLILIKEIIKALRNRK